MCIVDDDCIRSCGTGRPNARVVTIVPSFHTQSEQSSRVVRPPFLRYTLLSDARAGLTRNHHRLLIADVIVRIPPPAYKLVRERFRIVSRLPNYRHSRSHPDCSQASFNVIRNLLSHLRRLRFLVQSLATTRPNGPARGHRVPTVLAENSRRLRGTAMGSLAPYPRQRTRTISHSGALDASPGPRSARERDQRRFCLRYLIAEYAEGMCDESATRMDRMIYGRRCEDDSIFPKRNVSSLHRRHVVVGDNSVA